jgi:hypothetical protein
VSGAAVALAVALLMTPDASVFVGPLAAESRCGR